jgi:RHS repeat-associated protein
VLEYDDENELIRITQPNTWKSEFTYDGKMRRRIRKEYTWAGSSWLQTNEVHSIYDGSLVIQDRDLNNVPMVTYTRGTDLSGKLEAAGGIEGLLARTDMQMWLAGSALAHAFYHADGNGNITALVYTNQSIAAKYAYDSFGNRLGKIGGLADANIFQFSSKEFHPTSGIIYYSYRYYDPTLQRWISRDPLSDSGSVVFDSIRRKMTYWLYLKEQRKPNAILFNENDPINRVDAFGLQSWIGPGYGVPGLSNGMPGGGSNGNNCPCLAPKTSTPYWLLMGYEDPAACATAEWSLYRDTIPGIILGGMGERYGGTWGGLVGFGVGEALIPTAICNQSICH